MKGMIGRFDQMQCRAGLELFGDRLEQIRLRELVVAALQEQHWHMNFGEMIGAIGRRFSSWVQGKAEER